MNPRHPNFVEADAAGSRKDTAALLVGTAREFGIDQHDIKTASRGFYISDALADILEAETTEDDAVSGNEQSTNKTSGNRAGKNSNKKGK